jgi:hypothetical protein
MKTLQILLGVGAMIALLGMNIATADFTNESASKGLTFSMNTEDGSVDMPNVNFDDGAGTDESQTTCAMTPGGTMPNLLPPEPELPQLPPEQLDGYNRPQDTLAPINSLQTPPPSYSPTGLPNYPFPTTDGDVIGGGTPEEPKLPESAVPEPATLALLGLGLGAVVAARRRWRGVA